MPRGALTATTKGAVSAAKIVTMIAMAGTETKRAITRTEEDPDMIEKGSKLEAIGTGQHQHATALPQVT